MRREEIKEKEGWEEKEEWGEMVGRKDGWENKEEWEKDEKGWEEKKGSMIRKEGWLHDQN